METIFQRLKQKKMYYQYVKLLMRIHESPHYQTGLKYLVLQHRRLDSPSTKRQRERTTSNLFGINPPTEPEKSGPRANPPRRDADRAISSICKSPRRSRRVFNHAAPFMQTQ